MFLKGVGGRGRGLFGVVSWQKELRKRRDGKGREDGQLRAFQSTDRALFHLFYFSVLRLKWPRKTNLYSASIFLKP